VPTYEYECDKCRGVFEIRQRITEPALTTHEGCGGAVRRLLSPAPFILKGDGWYVTDYPSESRKKAVEAEKGGKKAEKGDKSSEATAKTDTKAESTSSSTSAGTSESAKPAASSTSSAGASSSSSSTST
jgi:putative FmdB family regulatory protein